MACSHLYQQLGNKLPALRTLQDETMPAQKFNRTSQTLSWVLTLVSFPVAGYLMGWLTGSSNSPVVGTMLPLAFSLIGALSYGLLERTKRNEDLLKVVHDMELDETVRDKITDALHVQTSSTWVRAFWAIGVMLFCSSCFWGLSSGIAARIPSHKSTEQLLTTTGVNVETLAVSEYANVCNLHYRLVRLNIPPDQVEALFRYAVAPVFRESNEYYVEKMGSRIETGREHHARAVFLAGLTSDVLYELEQSDAPASTPVFSTGGTAGPF